MWWLLLLACARGDVAGDSDVADTDVHDTDAHDDVVRPSPSETEDVDLAGMLLHQVLWNDDGTPNGTWTYAGFWETQPIAIERAYVGDGDRCVVDGAFIGWHARLDLGRKVELDVGDDVLGLSRDPTWEDGEVWYDRDAEVGDPGSDPVLGMTAGDELVLLGTPTGLRVPPRLEADLDVAGFLATGAITLSWEPTGADAVSFGAIVYPDGAYTDDVRVLSCTLVDDGAAVVDSGWTDIADGGGHFDLDRHEKGVVDVAGVGPVLVDTITDVQAWQMPE